MIENLLNSKYATGIDISKWNDKFDLDKLSNLPDIISILDFIILRAGYANASGSHKDEKFDEFYLELVQHPEPLRGAYWYMSSQTSWEDQSDTFLYILEGKEFDFLMLDFEQIYNVRSAGFALTAIRFLKKLQLAYPDKRILLYSNYYTYRDWLRAYTSECDAWPYHHAQYPWANWATVTEYFSSWWASFFNGAKAPWLPPSRNGSWELWQFVDKSGLGQEFGLGGENVDINISRRLLADFKNWIGSTRGVDIIDDGDNNPDYSMITAELNSAIILIESAKSKLENTEV